MDACRVLITGGTGFVGKHLQDELRHRGIEQVVFSSRDCDLTTKKGAAAPFSTYKDIGVILHLASYQAAGDFPAKHPAEQFHINNLIHINLLESWRAFAPHAKLIAIGTSCAYPSDAMRFTEERFQGGEIHGSVYSYAFTKRLLYTGILAYNDQYGLNGSYLIPATMFGEHDDFNVETAHVCGALIGKFVRAVREGIDEVEIWGDGTQVREFMDVKDFVGALLHLIPLCDRDIVNIGPGRGTSVKELALMISRAAGFEGRLVFNKERYVGVKEKVMDVRKLAQKYGYQVNPDLTAGIERTVQWVVRNYEKVQGRRKFESGKRSTHEEQDDSAREVRLITRSLGETC
jgi:GDP-L-fucose synthase